MFCHEFEKLLYIIFMIWGNTVPSNFHTVYGIYLKNVAYASN